jgi:hypothetical protein
MFANTDIRLNIMLHETTICGADRIFYLLIHEISRSNPSRGCRKTFIGAAVLTKGAQRNLRILSTPLGVASL